MALRTVSVDSGTPEQVHARNIEMNRHWASFADPLDILIRYEERAHAQYHLDDYDDPVVDREIVNIYISKRIGERHVIQSKQRDHRRTCRRLRTSDSAGATLSSWDAGEPERASWHNGARVVGRR